MLSSLIDGLVRDKTGCEFHCKMPGFCKRMQFIGQQRESHISVIESYRLTSGLGKPLGPHNPALSRKGFLYLRQEKLTELLKAMKVGDRRRERKKISTQQFDSMISIESRVSRIAGLQDLPV